MKSAARFLAALCVLAFPVAGIAQENDSTRVLRSVISAFHADGVKWLALRIHEDDPLDQHLFRSILDSTTIAAKPGHLLLCAWPEDNPPAGSGYMIDIMSLKMAGDSAIVAVISACDSGPANSHARFAIAENFILKKTANNWQVAKRAVRDFN